MVLLLPPRVWSDGWRKDKKTGLSREEGCFVEKIRTEASDKQSLINLDSPSPPTRYVDSERKCDCATSAYMITYAGTIFIFLPLCSDPRGIETIALFLITPHKDKESHPTNSAIALPMNVHGLPCEICLSHKLICATSWRVSMNVVVHN